ASMIWLSVNRDFFMVEIFLRKLLLLTALVLRGDYRAMAGRRLQLPPQESGKDPAGAHCFPGPMPAALAGLTGRFRPAGAGFQ
ncbi:hypothetical protein, partial [Stenotrophomonas pictorum]|uniref:hypothetical protein n=1 Tax=Stenotrophomonas pictorum TaxID=86184 RepID=UPI0019D6BCBF